MKKVKVMRKVSMVLAVTTLLLGVLSLPGTMQVRNIYADSSSETTPPADEGSNEENSQVPPVDENSSDENLQDPPVDETPVEDPQPEEELQVESFSVSSMTVSSPIGDDPNVQNELPDFGTNYNNGDCATNDACETAEPVTNPNEYSDQGSYGEKDYDLPEINGNEANIVAIKDGNNWYFFKKGSGETCVSSTFCVNYDDSGHVSVYSYQTQGQGYKGYNLINFWYVSDQEETVRGCTDASALNYNPSANSDDGSCSYDETVYGCTDPTALNFNPNATSNDESCTYDETVYGCTDPTALNFNALATVDDQSCNYEEDDPGGGGGGGGGTTTVTTALIPVTAQTAAGGPTEELILIPVTGVDNAFPLTTWQRLLFSASALLFGLNLIMEGISRKIKR